MYWFLVIDDKGIPHTVCCSDVMTAAAVVVQEGVFYSDIVSIVRMSKVEVKGL